MFWDKVSGLYDLFETIYNGKVFQNLGKKVSEEIDKNDIVLECACGTGAISECIAAKCKGLVATDFSEGMLKQTAKKCKKYNNVKVRCADINRLGCRDNRFDNDEARAFTGPEYFSLPQRMMVGFAFKTFVKKIFNDAAKKWGCTTPLDATPYADKNQR